MFLFLQAIDLRSVSRKQGHKPASDDDDIFRNVCHFFDGQVAHPSQGLLWLTKEEAFSNPIIKYGNIGGTMLRTNTNSLHKLKNSLCLYLTSLDWKSLVMAKKASVASVVPKCSPCRNKDAVRRHHKELTTYIYNTVFPTWLSR